MPDREKAIEGLECCVTMPDIYPRCEECPYADEEGTCASMNRLHRDALALLKAQEPHVMTLEEALDAEVNVDQCWLEVRCIKQIYLADAVVCPEHPERADIQRWGATDCQLPLDLYGEYWRMWTSRPTDKQREATPW